VTGNISHTNITGVNRLGEELLVLIKKVILNRSGNGAFISSCHEHCGQWSQNQTDHFPDYNVTILGWQVIPALSHWWNKTSTRREWVQSSSYPCVGCCFGKNNHE